MKVRVGRENYYKYHEVRDRLEEELQVEQPAHQIAEKLKIAVSTFHKYRSLLQVENGRQYITTDERSFRERLEATSENPKKKPSVPSETQSSVKAEPSTAPIHETVVAEAKAKPKPAHTEGRKKR